jgi:hypothetical protein
MIYGVRAEELCVPIVCNRQLKQCLLGLGNDCSSWPEPPRPGTEDDTLSYLTSALGWFSTNRQDAGRHTTPPEFTPYLNNDDVPPQNFLIRK